MGFLELFLIGVGLSMDAFAVPLSAYPNPTSCGEWCSFKPKDTPYLNR